MGEPASIEISVGPDPGPGANAEFRGDSIGVTLRVPGYDSTLELFIGVERSADGDWVVYVPTPEVIEAKGDEAEGAWIHTRDRLFRTESDHEGCNGIIYVGAPDT